MITSKISKPTIFFNARLKLFQVLRIFEENSSKGGLVELAVLEYLVSLIIWQIDESYECVKIVDYRIKIIKVWENIDLRLVWPMSK